MPPRHDAEKHLTVPANAGRARSQWGLNLSRHRSVPAHRRPTLLQRTRTPEVRWLALCSSLIVLLGVVGAYETLPDALAGVQGSASTVVIDDSQPGSVVSASPLAGVASDVAAASARSLRVVYHSTDGRSGDTTRVSGSAFLPNGTAPRGGWPVVAVGHEGSGIDAGCAPSLSHTLLGAAPLVAALLRQGYAVALTDYQGLGEADPAHEYLDATTAGRNLIDSVRALRGVFPNVSARWAAYGSAQGGGAAWAADQQATSYASELNLVGTVALSPITDASGLVDRAQNGTLTTGQRTTLLWSLASLGRTHPALHLDDYRHGVAARQWSALTACSGALVHAGSLAAKDLEPLDLAPSTPEAADALRALMREFAVTDRPLTAPLYVEYEADTGIPEHRWTGAAVNRACAAGGSVTWRLQHHAESRDVEHGDQIAWLAARFAGASTANYCRSGSVSAPGAGSVLSVQDIPGVDAALPSGSHAARVLYSSTRGDTGTPTVVSGTVFTPPGAPPPGGWPVLAYGHGTTGLDEGCGPSLSGSLLTQAPLVAAMLELGYAVAFADYEGLGAPGVHPYLDSRTAGLNIIDAVRALRATFPDVSTRWAGIGHSQGAAAVWAADEQASSYAPELELVGAVALAPPADVTGLVDKAVEGTLTTDQVAALQTIVGSMGRVFPGFTVEDFRRGSAVADWDVLASCDAAALPAREAATARLQAGDLAPATPRAADQLRWLLQRWALPQRQLSAPLSVVYGNADTFIDAQWTTDAVNRACALGDAMNVRMQPGKGHVDLDWIGQAYWLRDRFQGIPIINSCPET